MTGQLEHPPSGPYLPPLPSARSVRALKLLGTFCLLDVQELGFALGLSDQGTRLMMAELVRRGLVGRSRIRRVRRNRVLDVICWHLPAEAQ